MTMPGSRSWTSMEAPKVMDTRFMATWTRFNLTRTGGRARPRTLDDGHQDLLEFQDPSQDVRASDEERQRGDQDQGMMHDVAPRATKTRADDDH